MEETFSYSNEAVQSGAPAVEGVGFFTSWFFNMFAGAIDIQLISPILTFVYIVLLFALVILRLYTVNPVKSLGCLGVYVYATVQAYSLFSASPYVLDYTPAGWQVEAKSIVF
ncbi:MAG: hypothetical protein RLN70_05805, partial [Rhodospirillaceae bacterium]